LWLHHGGVAASWPQVATLSDLLTGDAVTASHRCLRRGAGWRKRVLGTANQYAIYGCYFPNSLGNCAGLQNAAAVGTANAGAGRWGQLDLAGDAFQWNLDSYSYPQGYFACTDCRMTDGAVMKLTPK
jgi:hypothetical protein